LIQRDEVRAESGESMPYYIRGAVVPWRDTS
jgi:hypothetical protein